MPNAGKGVILDSTEAHTLARIVAAALICEQRHDLADLPPMQEFELARVGSAISFFRSAS
jgi:hypothetical protein